MNSHNQYKELIFLWSDSNGVLVTRQHFEFLTKFYTAKKNSKTFGEFWCALGDHGREFVKVFMQSDSEFPRMDEQMKELESEIWILYDIEFPITQCAEETYTYYSDLMPSEYCKEKVQTEYGQFIGLFSVSDFVYIKDFMEDKYCLITSLRSPFPLNIVHYGN
jgi:hypothetical protein